MHIVVICTHGLWWTCGIASCTEKYPVAKIVLDRKILREIFKVVARRRARFTPPTHDLYKIFKSDLIRHEFKEWQQVSSDYRGLFFRTGKLIKFNLMWQSMSEQVPRPPKNLCVVICEINRDQYTEFPFLVTISLNNVTTRRRSILRKIIIQLGQYLLDHN